MAEQLCREDSCLVKKLKEDLSDDILVFSSPGLANILLFKDTASGLLRIVESEEDDKSIEIITKQIQRECKQLSIDKTVYNTNIDAEIAIEESSPTLLSFLSSLSDKLNYTLPGLLIGNIVSSILTNRSTSLQIALGVQLREKSQIESFYDFKVTCSYDEVLRFKASAAAAAARDVKSHSRAITDSKKGLIQAVADNFDASISSPNGLRSTHALALILTQEQKQNNNTQILRETIARVKKEDRNKEIIPDVPIKHYQGPKKPNMPHNVLNRTVQPLQILAEQAVVARRAEDVDFEFLKYVSSETNPMEFGGFNTKIAREYGHSLRPATTTMYTPLIDMVPSDPDTMMTAMFEAQRLTTQCGQTFTIFTADQQLYRVMVNVMWVHPEIFPNFYPRLGGMHMLMSFVGCVGVLMANSGLEDVLKSAFGGVARMLTGKNFPQNVRALRMVCEEVVRGVMHDIDSYDELNAILESKGSESRTSKLWLDCLVKPVLIMMLFVRAEREAEWVLHLYAVASMMPYFFVAGHVNYARYGLYYLRSMENLPLEVQTRFRAGEHVMRHKAGIWNALWSDMFIETTFMRYGHGPGGLIGITLSPSALKRWALSLHTCSRLLKDLNDMRDSSVSNAVTIHKEEGEGRIVSDSVDRQNIREKLNTCINPFDPNEHSEGLINIVTGQISPNAVNVDRSVEIGRKQMSVYEDSLPEGFNNSLSSKVTTMEISKKGIKCGSGIVYDTQLIYSRVMGLISSRSINLKDLFSHELAPVPTSMFDDNGNMRLATSKSVLKNKLSVVQSSRILSSPDVVIIDGCAILWCIHWPSHGSVQDYIDNFWCYVSKRLNRSDVYVIFDRYMEYSIKSDTRKNRSNHKASSGHKLNLNTPLPPQHAVLTSTENKVQLIDMICDQLKHRAANIPAFDIRFNQRLVVTGAKAVPQEIHMGVLIERQDLCTTHEEADVIIPQQLLYATTQGVDKVTVVCDDTDVFVLLLHFYYLKKLTCCVIMEATNKERSIIDIAATVKKHSEIVPHLLAAHALTGCDTVARLCGIGKGTVVKKLQNGLQLNKLGDVNADIDEVISESTHFIATCYGKKGHANMSDVRYDVWLAKTGSKTIKRTPKLRSLPPTSETFSLNVKRAHIQTCIWKSALEENPPALDPSKFGWAKDANNKQLTPVTTSSEKPLAPGYILQMICCGCSSTQPCATTRCGCFGAQLSCSIFCKCHQKGHCENRWTKATVDAEDAEAQSEHEDSDNDE